MLTGLLANCPVTDVDRAEAWYDRLLARGSDVRPMPGLVEWRLAPTFGLQVWHDPLRAGHATVVLQESDLDEAAERLTAAGVEHDGPHPGGEGRIVQLADPDGNSVVLVGA